MTQFNPDDAKRLAELEQTLKQELDESSLSISSNARQRLFEARQQALALARRQHASTGKPWQVILPFNFLQPMAPLATAATFAVAILYLTSISHTPEIESFDNTDSELLFSTDEFEMYEDLEFYAWLAENELG
jgi:hypothetical protein